MNSPIGRGKGMVAYTLLCNHMPLQGWLMGTRKFEAQHAFDNSYRNTSDIVSSAMGPEGNGPGLARKLCTYDADPTRIEYDKRVRGGDQRESSRRGQLRHGHRCRLLLREDRGRPGARQRQRVRAAVALRPRILAMTLFRRHSPALMEAVRDRVSGGSIELIVLREYDLK